MDIRYFFKLQSTFQRNSIIKAAAQEKCIFTAAITGCKNFNLIYIFQ